MRIALISLSQTAPDDPATALGALSLAGKSIAERQLDLADALGCERVLSLAAGLDRQLLSLQHRIEGAGKRFNVVSNARALVGLVSANDELVAFADGLLPAAADVRKALGESNGVLVLPVEAGIAAGFERIDLNYAWAGVLAMPGRLVERIAELPLDCDTISSLLRIALQGRVPERVLPEAALAEGRWALVKTRGQLAEIEPDWFRRHAAAPNWFAPGRALARLAVRLFGGRLLEGGFKPGFLVLLGLLLAAGSVAVAWSGSVVAAFVLAGAGWLAAEVGGALASLARDGAGGETRTSKLGRTAGIFFDIALVAVLALSLDGDWPARLFAPLVLAGLLRLGGSTIRTNWGELLDDRALLVVLLGIAVGFRMLMPAIEFIDLALLALLLGVSQRTAKLTRA